MNVQAMRDTWAANIQRVGNLIALYEVAKGAGKGRASVEQQDLLRASVVFAHASLESLTRALLERRIRSAAPDDLSSLLSFPSASGTRTAKVSWPFLLDRLGTTVDRILDEAVQHYLDHFNLNHPADLVNALRVSGLSATGPKVLEGGRGAAVEALMKRRHWIVHQLDRNAVSGPGHFVAQSISLPTAQTFRHTAVEIGEIILADAAELP